jgi:hypothetical protein
MRKLRQAKKHMESVRPWKLTLSCVVMSSVAYPVCVQATDDAEAESHKAEYERYREDMMYIYYYPRSVPYLSLLPSKPHSDDELQRCVLC